jgi:membrane protease YdiL (CAAX protease family)
VAGLALVAVGLGEWLGVPPLAGVAWTTRGLAAGVAATAPLCIGLWWCHRTRAAPIRRLVTLVEERIGPLFAGCTIADLALVAAAAGLGEELLFRGVLQPALAVHLPVWVTVVVVAAVFGAVHWLTPIYALLAGLVGVYLGGLALLAQNLLVPIVTHALYDLVALLVLTRVKPTPTPTVL